MYEESLYHHGIKGQKWGVRRFQKSDGSLTSAGKRRYAQEEVDKKIKAVGETKTEKFEKEWRKKNPNKDYDDLGDELVDNPNKAKGLYDEDKTYSKKAKLYSDRNKLSDNYVRTQTIGAAVISACYLAPISGFVVGKKTHSLTNGILASAGSAKKEQNQTVEKYYNGGK